MRVIILSTSKYKEKDCIYDAISEDGPISFKARGAQESKSPFVWLNNILTVADVDFAEGKYKYPVLKSATLVSSSITGSNELEYLYALSALAEITKDTLADDDKKLAFKDLQDAINALKQGKDSRMVVLIYSAHCITYAGAQLEVDKCVFSGSKSDIVAFSFADGGFVSRPYLTEEMNCDLTVQQMKLIRYVFKVPNYSCVDTEKYTKEDKIVLLNKFIEFIDEFLGVRITSLNYLIK